MSLGDESGLGPDPATYAPLGQPVAVQPNDELVPDGTPADESSTTEAIAENGDA